MQKALFLYEQGKEVPISHRILCCSFPWERRSCREGAMLRVAPSHLRAHSLFHALSMTFCMSDVAIEPSAWLYMKTTTMPSWVPPWKLEVFRFCLTCSFGCWTSRPGALSSFYPSSSLESVTGNGGNCKQTSSIIHQLRGRAH